MLGLVTLFASLALVVKAGPRVEALLAIPRVRDTLDPLNTIKVDFAGGNSGATANVVLETTKKAINLINFPTIQKVYCNGPILTIEFVNTQVAADALRAWAPFAAQENLILITAPQHGCAGHMLGFLNAKNLFLQKQTITVTQEVVSAEKVVSGFQLQASQVAVPQNEHVFKATVPLNLNYDGKEVQQGVVPLVNNKDLTVDCEDCFLKGNVKVSTVIIGSLMNPLYSIRFGLEGELPGIATEIPHFSWA